jgi:D-alanyl-D-alanine carboxypeptidase
MLAMGVIAAAGQAYPAAARPSAPSAAGDASLAGDLRADLAAYLHDHASDEHVSAAALSVSLPGSVSTIDVSAGTTRFGGSRPVTPDSVWQIGSNTKAFTSVLLLKLEAEHKLSIHDTVGRWLPQYPRWRDVTISSLLHMTSGIPPFDEQPAFMAAFAAHPYREFSKEQLVAYAIGAPATSGYRYSNTNYILAEMIIEKATRDSYQHQLYTRIIGPLGLRDLFYRPGFYPPQVTAREPAGYYFDATVPALASLVGRDASRFTLSWTRGAGGIVSTTHDMTVWERALYGGALLPARQQAELMSLVAENTGQPIEQTSKDHPVGFGLGVEQITGPNLGTVWLYEGGTAAFRTLHVYVPESGVILALGLNSYTTPNTTDSVTDQISSLAVTAYATLIAHGLVSALPAPRQLTSRDALTRRYTVAGSCAALGFGWGQRARQREPGAQRGAGGGRAADVHRALQRAHPVAQADQAAGLQPGLGPADPVVAHLDRAPVLLDRHPYPGHAGLRVLDHVGERLGTEEVDARLDGLRESSGGDVQTDRQGKPVGQRFEGGGQAAKRQDRGMDAGRDLTQPVDAAAGVTER